VELRSLSLERVERTWISGISKKNVLH